MTRKSFTLIGAAVGLALFLAIALLPSLLYGGYAGVLLAGGIFGTPVKATLLVRGAHHLRNGAGRGRSGRALRGRRRGGGRGRLGPGWRSSGARGRQERRLNEGCAFGAFARWSERAAGFAIIQARFARVSSNSAATRGELRSGSSCVGGRVPSAVIRARDRGSPRPSPAGTGPPGRACAPARRVREPAAAPPPSRLRRPAEAPARVGGSAPPRSRVEPAGLGRAGGCRRALVGAVDVVGEVDRLGARSPRQPRPRSSERALGIGAHLVGPELAHAVASLPVARDPGATRARRPGPAGRLRPSSSFAWKDQVPKQ